MKSAILIYDELIDWLGQTCREIEGDKRPQTQISRCRDRGGAQQRRCHRMAAALWCCVKPAKKGESGEASLGRDVTRSDRVGQISTCRPKVFSGTTEEQPPAMSRADAQRQASVPVHKGHEILSFFFCRSPGGLQLSCRKKMMKAATALVIITLVHLLTWQV